MRRLRYPLVFISYLVFWLGACSGESSGPGKSAADVQFKEDGQRWVAENIGEGEAWRPKDWIQKFGKYQELQMNMSSPELLKAYYFPRIDITLIVNVWRKEIATWRFGRAYSL